MAAVRMTNDISISIIQDSIYTILQSVDEL
jgi:hypothetical protein